MPPLRHYRPETIAAQLEAAAVSFGENLRRWRVAQGWSQNTPQDWGKAVGVLHVFNSQWSQLESAKLRGPKPTVFRALGVMNVMLHAGQYGPIKDRALMDRVRAAEAICHEDGEPWDGRDFYAAFLGDLQFPVIANRLPPITDAEAAEISNGFRTDVRNGAKRRSLALRAAADQLLDHVPDDQHGRLEDVLLGDAWTAAELMALRDPDGEMAPRAWLAEWDGEAATGSHERPLPPVDDAKP
jgi:transcriptional regulator with XRE-family HTH domain